ncbi:MAG: response regulator, partial [Methylovirgula sp.]
MSISKAISSHIPYLRRFARALTGTQTGGDAYVLATLEAVVAEPEAFGENVDLRASLYRL